MYFTDVHSRRSNEPVYLSVALALYLSVERTKNISVTLITLRSQSSVTVRFRHFGGTHGVIGDLKLAIEMEAKHVDR